MVTSRKHQGRNSWREMNGCLYLLHRPIFLAVSIPCQHSLWIWLDIPFHRPEWSVKAESSAILSWGKYSLTRTAQQSLDRNSCRTTTTNCWWSCRQEATRSQCRRRVCQPRRWSEEKEKRRRNQTSRWGTQCSCHSPFPMIINKLFKLCYCYRNLRGQSLSSTCTQKKRRARNRSRTMNHQSFGIMIVSWLQAGDSWTKSSAASWYRMLGLWEIGLVLAKRAAIYNGSWCTCTWYIRVLRTGSRINLAQNYFLVVAQLLMHTLFYCHVTVSMTDIEILVSEHPVPSRWSPIRAFRES